MLRMNVTPIQIMDKGIRIPIEYVGDVREFVLEVEEDAIWLRPKENGFHKETDDPNPEPKQGWLQQMVGMVETSNPTASVDVEAILADEFGVSGQNE